MLAAKFELENFISKNKKLRWENFQMKNSTGWGEASSDDGKKMAKFDFVR